MYRYSEIETALLRLHELPDVWRGAFSARLKYFQRIGILDRAPGKGSRLEYTFSDLCLLALCLEFSEFGIEPQRIIGFSKWLRFDVLPVLVDKKTGVLEDELYYASFPTFLSRAAIAEHEERADDGSQGLWPINMQTKRMIIKSSELEKKRPTRAILINLSDLHRRIVKALQK